MRVSARPLQWPRHIPGVRRPRATRSSATRTSTTRARRTARRLGRRLRPRSRVRSRTALGRDVDIWRDRARTATKLPKKLIDRLRAVATLCRLCRPAISNRYGTPRAEEFAAPPRRRRRPPQVGTKRACSRCSRHCAAREHPPPLLQFSATSSTGWTRPAACGGPSRILRGEAHRDFWLRLEDLAHDLGAVLQLWARRAGPRSRRRKGHRIFLAETTSELKELS